MLFRPKLEAQSFKLNGTQPVSDQMYGNVCCENYAKKLHKIIKLLILFHVFLSGGCSITGIRNQRR